MSVAAMDLAANWAFREVARVEGRCAGGACSTARCRLRSTALRVSRARMQRWLDRFVSQRRRVDVSASAAA